MTDDHISKILIVDDTPMNVEYLQDIISLEHETITAYSGEEALNKVKSDNPDMILLDVMMPGMDGFEVCEIIKSDAKTRFIPVVMVTALSKEEDRIKGIDAGADDFLTKPPNQLELKARIRSLLRIKHMHDALHESEERFRNLNEKLESRVGERTVELEAKNQELEALTYSVAHDLRGPLRHMGGYSQIIKSKYKEILPEEALNYLDNILKSSIYMGKLNDELIKLIGIGQQELNIISVNLNDIINGVINECKPSLNNREIEWKINELPGVECDQDMIGIVIRNLISNALKFTNNNDHTVIEISPLPEGRPGFMVRDNGIGFNIKYHDKIFGGFQRLHRKDEYDGTGIGLAVAQRIIKKHKGRIWAEAEENKGATFFIELPDANQC